MAEAIDVLIERQANGGVKVVPLRGAKVIIRREAGVVRIVGANIDRVSRDRDFWLSTILRTTNLDGVRRGGEKQLEELIVRISHETPLSPARRDRLLLAGRGDLSRFLSDCDTFADAASRPSDGTERDWELQSRSRELRKRYLQGFFTPDSLFARTLAAQVDSETFNMLQRQLDRPLDQVPMPVPARLPLPVEEIIR
jgi:hypothetical protein